MASPAASSLAELILNPVDSRSIDFESCPSEALRAFWAITALKLVLMNDMFTPQGDELQFLECTI
jgi:hypothetical protein